MALALVFRFASNHAMESVGCASLWIAMVPALALLAFTVSPALRARLPG